MFENPRRGRQARNFTTNAPKILDLKSSSEQIFSRKLPLGVPDRRIHSRLVRRHVWEPDKERLAHSLPYLEILKGCLKDSIFTIRQQKMAHEMLSSLLVNNKRTI